MRALVHAHEGREAVHLGELDRAEAIVRDFEERGRALDRLWARATAARARSLLLSARGERAPAGLRRAQRNAASRRHPGRGRSHEQGDAGHWWAWDAGATAMGPPVVNESQHFVDEQPNDVGPNCATGNLSQSDGVSSGIIHTLVQSDGSVHLRGSFRGTDTVAPSAIKPVREDSESRRSAFLSH